MLRSAASKVMWVGRATVFLVGLAVILALVFGAASTAMSATGGNFILGKGNRAETPTVLVSTLADALKSALVVQNKSGGAALDLRVGNATTPPNDVAPMKVNSTKKVPNLNADRMDNREASSFADGVGGVATNADKLDGKDAGEFLSHDGTAQDSQSLGGIPAHGYQQRIAWAAVFLDGTIQKGYGAVSATKTSTGQYKVTFAGSVPSHCATLATAHGASGTGYFAAYTNSDGTVSVNTRNTSSLLADNHFYLVVLC